MWNKLLKYKKNNEIAFWGILITLIYSAYMLFFIHPYANANMYFSSGYVKNLEFEKEFLSMYKEPSHYYFFINILFILSSIIFSQSFFRTIWYPICLFNLCLYLMCKIGPAGAIGMLAILALWPIFLIPIAIIIGLILDILHYKLRKKKSFRCL